MNTLSWIVDHSLSTRLTLALLHFLWQGCVGGMLVAIGGWVLHGVSARARYSLNVAVMLAMGACLPTTFFLLERTVGIERPTFVASDRSLQPAATPRAEIAGAVAEEASSIEHSVMAETVSEIGIMATDRAPAGAMSSAWLRSSRWNSETLVAFSPWIAVLYLTGVGLVLARLLRGVWGGYRLRKLAQLVDDPKLLEMVRQQASRLGLIVAPRVAWCERISVPVVVGVLSPMILLPAAVVGGLTPGQLQALLLHELSHIRRFDPIVNLLQRVIEAILFFHPAIWFVSRRVSIERELAADDMVLAAGWDRPLYADALVRVAELASLHGGADSLALGATGTNPSEFKRRVLRLLVDSQPPKLDLSRVGILAALLFVVLGGALAWSQTKETGSKANPPAARANPPAATAGDSKPVASEGTLVLQKPSLLLPDHYILAAVGFDQNDKEIVTVSYQYSVTIRRWDVAEKKLISEVKLEADKHGRKVHVDTIKLSGDRKRVIAATDAYVGIWDTSTGKMLKRLTIPKIENNDTVRFLDCTPDLSVIVGNLDTEYYRLTLAFDAYTAVWNGNTGKLVRTTTHDLLTHMQGLTLSPDGTRYATTNQGGPEIWDTVTGKKLLYVPNDNKEYRKSNPERAKSSPYDNVWSIQFSPDGKQLAIGDTLGVKLVDAFSGKLLKHLEGSYNYSSSSKPPLVFSKDGQWLARLGTEKEEEKNSGYVAPIWSTQSGQKLFELHGSGSDAAFSADNKSVAICFSDMQQGLAVWDLSSKATDAEPAGPGPHSRVDRVEENGHYQGEMAAKFVEEYKPIWGETKNGIQYGIAFTKPQQSFKVGERVPLVVFFRNAGDKPLKVDTRPDCYGNLPKVVNDKGEEIALENVPLLGTLAHYVENLAPGEAFGPLYLNFGLGENPRPGKQYWHPYYKTPVAGKYRLGHVVDANIGGQKEGDTLTPEQLTSGELEFEIVDGAAEKKAEDPVK
jgi:beta-lactamase regulating signal transducer with metallopeptidase domain/WD40 repeat protein